MSAEVQTGFSATPYGASLESLLETHEPVKPIGEFQGDFQRLGMVPVEGGYNFSVAVDAKVVHAVDVCIHDSQDPFKIVKRWQITEAKNEVEPRCSDVDSTHALGGFIPVYDAETGMMIGPGTKYSLRVVDSDWTRNESHIQTADIPLLDPRARRVLLMGPNEFSPTMNGVSEYPISVITTDGPYEWHHPKPEIRREAINMCEVHTRATLGMPMAPERDGLQGTYAALRAPEFIQYLDEQGYNALSLLPVHLSMSEPHLQREGRRNHWGYSTGSYFALNESYAATDDPISEFRQAVDALHGAGKKVYLDVVYNHTAEGGVADPTYSYEALNRNNMYKFEGQDNGNPVDDTGCGNTLNVTNPVVVSEIVESLHYWVAEMGVDGFRFDLAGVLAQGGYYYKDDKGVDWFRSPLLDAIQKDPILSSVDLIAEPWGGTNRDYKLDEYRHIEGNPWAAWNDKYRDAVKGQAAGFPNKKELADFMLGSKKPLTTVNYVTSHDGPTLSDALGGDIRAQRLAHAILAVSQGVSMRQAGSEMGYTQYGDHNAYSCGRNELAPYRLPWQEVVREGSPHAELYEFTGALHGIRNRHPIFRQAQTPHGKVLRFAESADGKDVVFGTDVVGNHHPLEERAVAWLTPWGRRMNDDDEWEDPDQFLAMQLAGASVGDDNFIVALNSNNQPVRMVLGSDAHPSARGVYEVMVDTDTGIVRKEGTGEIAEEAIVVAPRSLMVLRQIAQRLPNGHPALNTSHQGQYEMQLSA